MQGTNAANDGETESSGKRARLFEWDSEAELTYKQVLALIDGVRAALENSEVTLGVPGDLSNDRWSHAGIGVSVYMHESGLVILETEGERLVTTAETLDNVSMARAKFFGEPGTARVREGEEI